MQRSCEATRRLALGNGRSEPQHKDISGSTYQVSNVEPSNIFSGRHGTYIRLHIQTCNDKVFSLGALGDKTSRACRRLIQLVTGSPVVRPLHLILPPATWCPGRDILRAGAGGVAGKAGISRTGHLLLLGFGLDTRHVQATAGF